MRNRRKDKQNGLIGLVVMFVGTFLVAQPGQPDSVQRVKITNLTVHVGNGEVIEKAAIIFRGDEIEFVGYAEVAKNYAADKEIDGEGGHAYPGFIALNTILGLTEIDAVRATLDFNETGKFNPNVRSAIAYNAESKIIPTVRSNGILLAEITPRGGVISGTSSVMKLEGWNWEDALVKEDIGVHLQWPSYYQRSGWWAEPGPRKPNENYKNSVREIIDFFREAYAYCKESYHAEKNLRYEAMRGIFNKTRKLFVHADQVNEITDAVLLLDEFPLSMVIVGGYEAWKVAELLNDKSIPIVLRRIHELPENESDPLKQPYKIPAMLYEKKVKFCFQNAGDMEAMQTRNLPFMAGTAVAYGLPYEEAVKALTLYPAQIAGIEYRYGTLEKGKSATFFVSRGDALDIKTNHLTYIFIHGKPVSPDTFQLDLYRKYARKYGIEP